MFRYQVDAFKQADRRIRIQRTCNHFYITLDDDKRLTQSTEDRHQAEIWKRIVTVQFALSLLGITRSVDPVLAATNAYMAFYKEVTI